MKTKVPIDIVIPTMNRTAGLRRTLQGIYNSEVHPQKIIIVDQSEDRSKQLEIQNMLEYEFNTLNIKYLFQPEPSLTKARNNGFKLTTSEIVICMDDDVDIKLDTIYNVYKLMNNSSVSMIAGMDSGYICKGKKISSMMGYIFYKKSFLKRKIGHVTKSNFGRFPSNIKGTVNTEWAMGFFFVIRKSLVEKWNLKWDEKLISYAYAEDLDFSYQYYLKSREEKYECIMHESIIVTHLATKEWRISNRKELFMLIINRLYLNYKLFKSPFARIAYQWTNIGLLIEKIVYKDNYKEYLYLWNLAIKYRKKIKLGEIPYHLIIDKEDDI